jgi:hypothetical protein
VAAASTIFEGFSLSHCAILDGTTGAEAADLYGVREATLDLDTDQFDNTGDDAVLSNWSWLNFATVSVTAGFIPLEVVALLSGSTLVTTGTAPNISYSIPLWNEKSINQPARPMLIRVPSKDASGLTRVMDFVLYKVQFSPISFTGPSYKDGLVVNYTGKALMSGFDEKGAALTEKSVGRLINKAPGTV